jgi:hypothetical protein
MIGINAYMTPEGLRNSEILTNIGIAILGGNFDVTSGRVACETCSATWNLGTNLAFSIGSRNTTENLDRVYRSQDLPDADRLPARSPAFKYVNHNMNPSICAVVLFEKNVYIFVSTHFF